MINPNNRYKLMPAKFAGKCGDGDRGCGRRIAAGEQIAYFFNARVAMHPACAEACLADFEAECAASDAEYREQVRQSAERAATMKAQPEVLTPTQVHRGWTAQNSHACTRCGGTGRYVRNAWGDDTCYGCQGEGRKPRGRSAR